MTTLFNDLIALRASQVAIDQDCTESDELCLGASRWGEQCKHNHVPFATIELKMAPKHSVID